MKLLLDMGNTRLKWGLADEGQPDRVQLQRSGALDYGTESLAAWAEECQSCLLDDICFASVVDAEREKAVLSALPGHLGPRRLQVSESIAGLENAYATPETLGVDRWAAAIGAWSLMGGPCLVISAGTATTVDLIQVNQRGAIYRGGLILPGVSLMLEALHKGTARLPQAVGVYRAAPDVADNTLDAMTSGALEATCGAIERMAQRLDNRAPWVITGGGAPRLASVLGARAKVIDGLVLEGLARV